MLLGEKLKVVRNKIGMSQNEVAENLRISRQTVSKWENNVCLPDLENFQKICKLYKIDVNTILEKEEENKDNNEIIINYSCYLIPFFFIKVLLDKKFGKQVCKKYILLLICNIFITILVVLIIYSQFPKSTTSELNF